MGFIFPSERWMEASAIPSGFTTAGWATTRMRASQRCSRSTTPAPVFAWKHLVWQRDAGFWQNLTLDGMRGSIDLPASLSRPRLGLPIPPLWLGQAASAAPSLLSHDQPCERRHPAERWIRAGSRMSTLMPVTPRPGTSSSGRFPSMSRG